MADDSERPDEEQEGGPVKSFLEHLEDLRWVLIRSVTALGVGMLICLIGANYVTKILKWPLTRARIQYSGTNQVVTVRLGDQRLGVYRLTPEQQQTFELGTNRFIAVQLEPARVGTNHYLALRVDTNPTVAETSEYREIELINLNPAGGFVVAFQVAVYGGLVLAGPFIFYFVSAFVFPALRFRERKYVNRGLVVGVGLFLGGVSFCYFVLMPLALSASQLYSQWLGFGSFQWKAEDYISFVCKFMLGMGLGFELPVLILTLVKIGVLDYARLSKGRRYVVVINLILGAVLTTPEVITQLAMFVPLQLLYEISVWVAWYWEQPDRAKARRRLALALVLVGLLGWLAWLGFRQIWPWVLHHVH